VARAEELRQQREEEMYAAHERHRADIDEQRHQLAAMLSENERARALAEEELREARDSLAREKHACKSRVL